MSEVQRPKSRQLEILCMSACGIKAAEIALRMDSTEAGIRQELVRLREVIEAKNTTHAVTICIGLGFIYIDDAHGVSPTVHIRSEDVESLEPDMAHAA